MLTLMFAAAALAAPPVTAAGEAPRAFAEGQVWEYRTRPQDRGSLMRIQRIEPHLAGGSDDRIYHISIIGVRFATPGVGGELQHLPVSRASLDASVTRLSASAAVFPDPSEGIALWREARGGVFDVPLAEIVAFAEQAVARGTPQPQ